METRTLQGRRTATLSICGPITDEGAVLAAVDLGRLAGEAFYGEVAVEITSDGGAISAMRHLADAFARLGREGVRVVTRVPIRAASAAALLASLGAVREASARAELLYHGARLQQLPSVTARAAEALGGSLAETDRLLVRELAERSLRAAPPEGSAGEAAERLAGMDPMVLARLAGTPDGGPAEALGRLRALLAECRGSGDPEPVAGLLGRLFELDAFISPVLALELGLIDRVLPPGGAGGGEAPARGPALEVPEWRALHPGGMVEEAQLRRHVLVLGESGSGKTASGVLPLAAALARTPGRLACALVIDPKRELLGRLRAAAAPGVAVRALDARALRGFRVMGGGEAALRADVEAGRVLTAATAMLVRCSELAADEGLASLAGRPPAAREPYWPREGARLAVTVLALALTLMRRRPESRPADPEAAAVREWAEELERDRRALAKVLGGGRAPKRPQPPKGREWQLSLRSRAVESRFHEACRPSGDGLPGLNAVAAAAWLLQEAFWPSGGRTEGPAPFEAGFPEPASSVVAARLAADVGAQPGLSGEEREAARRAADACAMASEGATQYMGVAGHAAASLAHLAAPGVDRGLSFGVEPGAGEDGAALDLPALVDGRGGPTVLVHQPDGGGTIVARALKAAFFEAVLDSPARRAGGQGMPLAAYVADEFHRFATASARHGEQSFLDACRSFGCVCALACQGISSIRHALSESGAGEAGWHAVDVLLTNTATKLVFRTSERDSLQLVDALSPLAANGMSLSRTRPPAAMAPGECYAALADGRFERRQLDMLPGGGGAPEPADATEGAEPSEPPARGPLAAGRRTAPGPGAAARVPGRGPSGEPVATEPKAASGQ